MASILELAKKRRKEAEEAATAPVKAVPDMPVLAAVASPSNLIPEAEPSALAHRRVEGGEECEKSEISEERFAATKPAGPASKAQAPGRAMTPTEHPEPIPEALRDAYETLQASVLLKIASGTADLAVEATEDLTPGTVLVAVARRGKFSCVLAINPEKYDGVRLLELIEKHTVH